MYIYAHIIFAFNILTWLCVSPINCQGKTPGQSSTVTPSREGSQEAPTRGSVDATLGKTPYPSPMWWEQMGRPYLKPEAGIFMIPQANVYIPQAIWTHIIDINLPCLMDILKSDIPVSWTSTVNSISALIASLSNNTIIKQDRLLLEQFIYMTYTHQNIIYLLTNIKNHIVRINDHEQYIYGYMDRVCPTIETDLVRDAPLPLTLEEKWMEGFNEIETADKSVEGYNKITGKTTFKANFLKHLSDAEIISSLHALLHPPTTTETQLPRKVVESSSATPSTTTTTTPKSIIPPVNKTEEEPDLDEHGGDTFSRQKREYPKVESFAKNVVNQFVNYGPFTNNPSPLGGTVQEQWTAIDQHEDNQSTQPIRHPEQHHIPHNQEFQSQKILITEGGVQSSAVPIITNYGAKPVVPNSSPSRADPVNNPNKFYEPTNPKEKFVATLGRLLDNLNTPDETMTFKQIIDNIKTYYSRAWDDITTISSPNPLHIEPVQLGVMTIKVCFNYQTESGLIKSNCEDRFLANDKKWIRGCSGVTASNTQPFIDRMANDQWSQNPSLYIKNLINSYRMKTIDSLLDTVGIQNDHPNRRPRRGLGDGIMDYIWKPLFGSASEGDVLKISQFINDSRDAMSGIVSEQKQMISLQRDTTDRVNSLTESLRNMSSLLMEAIDESKSDLEKIWPSIERMNSRAEAAASLSAIAAMHHYVSQALTMLKLKLEDISTKYRTLYNMVRRRYISPSVLSGETLGDLMKDFDLFKSDKWMIAPSWSKLATIDDKSAEMYVHNRTLLITLKIPLVSITEKYSTYLSQSVPLLLGNKILEAADAGSYYIIDHTNQNWVKLEVADYATCARNPGNICPMTHPIHSFKNNNCYVNIVVGKDLSLPNKICNMQLLSGTTGYIAPSEGFASKSISANQWILSVLNLKGIQTFERCEGKDPNIAGQTSIQTLTGVNVLQVTEGCRIQVGETLFQASINWRSNNHHMVMFDDSLRINSDGFKNVSVWKMSSLISSALRNATVFSFEVNTRTKKNSYIFKKGITSLQTILDATSGPALDHSMIGLIEPVIPDVPIFDYKEPTSWSLSHWQIWSFLLGSVPMIVAISCILYLVLKKVFSARSAAATVAFSALPTSFTKASRILDPVLNISSVLEDISAARQALDQSLSQHKIHLNETLAHEMSSSTSEFWWKASMISFMSLMLFMGIHHCIMVIRTRKVVQHLLRSVRAFPKNKTVTMHNVEEPLVFVFLVEVFRLFSRNPSSTTMAVQVATLPSPLGQWYIKDKTNIPRMASETTIYRHTKRLIISLNWTWMCFLTKVYPDLDTCRDMPRFCIISQSGVELGIEGGLPWNWTSIHQKRILKVEIGKVGNSQVLYEYTEPDMEGFHHVPISTPLMSH